MKILGQTLKTTSTYINWSLLLAVVLISAWAALSVGVGVLLAVWPFSDWDKSQKLAVIQITVAVGGFVALVFAVYEILPQTLPQARLRLEMRLIGPVRRLPANLGATVAVLVNNVGEVVSNAWEVEMLFVASTATLAGDAQTWLQRGDPWVNQTAGVFLFPYSPVEIGQFDVTTDLDGRELVVIYRFTTGPRRDSRWRSVVLSLPEAG